MGFFKALDISASGLTAQRLKMDVIAQNIACESVTRAADGQPYRRRYAVLEEGPSFSGIYQDSLDANAGNGVRVKAIMEDDSAFNLIFDPSHPDADAEGYVRMPNVDIAREMVDMAAAVRSYESNITAVNAFKNIAAKTLEIGK